MKKRNEVMLKGIGEEKSLLKIFRKRKKSWVAHILKGEYFQRQFIEGKIEEKRG